MTMKIKSLLTLLAIMASVPNTATAGFNFSSPFDWADNGNNSSRYGSGDRYGNRNNRDSYKNYDQWEPNYWSKRYLDSDSSNFGFDRFRDNQFFDGGDFFGNTNSRNQGRFDFDMNSNMDGRYDGEYDSRYQNNNRDSGRYENYERSGSNRNARQDDQYNDDYWRDYSSRQYNNRNSRNNRNMSRAPERQNQNKQKHQKQAVECQ